MKVLHLTAGNLYGGVETLLTTLARLRHLAPGMEPEFALCFRGRQWDELTASGVTVHDLGPVRVSRPWTVLRARGRLRRVLANARPDVAVAHNIWPHAIFAPVARRAGVRLVHMAHGPLAGVHWLERWAARTPPDLVVANSRFTADTVATVFSEVPVAVWHLPVAAKAGQAYWEGEAPAEPRLPEARQEPRPPSKTHDPKSGATRSEARSEFGTPDDRVVVLQASRLERWKGQAVLLDALARLKDVPGWECWVAGGPQRSDEETFLAELRAAADRAGIADRVRFLGQRSDVARLMAAADVYCQPNAGPEPFGIALVEALYAGLPVVTSGFGGAAEIVDGSCGVTTPPGDAAAVAVAVGELIRDPDRRRTLGACGPERARALCDPARQMRRLADTIGGKHP